MKDEDFVKELRAIVEKNLQNSSFTLEDLCKECGLSRSQLHRKIKKLTGFSTSLYIRHVRLEHAKNLLTDDSLNISEICYDVGFGSPQNLSKYFHKAYGMSPSQYREKAKAHKIKIADSTNTTDEMQLAMNEFILQHPQGRLGVGAPWFSSSYVFIGLPILVLILGGFWIAKSGEGTPSSNTLAIENTSPLINEHSIAVLPFKNLGPTTADHFCSGILDEILTKLSYFDQLKVISRTSSESFKNTLKPIKIIAKELGVAYILEGSVQTSGDNVSISAQLINAREDSHVWAKNYKREVQDIFQIQNEISLEIAKALKQKITKETSALIEQKFIPSLNAYNEYLLGKSLVKENSKASLLRSIDHFERAISENPLFTDAIVQKANAFNALAEMGSDKSKWYTQEAQKFAQQAIQINPEKGMAYAILANTYKNGFDWNQALVSYDLALKYSSNDAMINYWYSLLLRELGKMDEAVEYSDKACELDPLYPVFHAGHIVNCIYAGQKEQAQKSIDEGKEVFKDAFVYHWAVGEYAKSQMDYKTSISSYEEALRLNPDFEAAQTDLMFCMACLGEEEKVKDFIALKDTEEGKDLFAVAKAFAGLKDVDNCLLYLNKAIEKGYIPHDLPVNPAYDFLRENPKFKAILTSLGYDAYLNS